MSGNVTKQNDTNAAVEIFVYVKWLTFTVQNRIGDCQRRDATRRCKGAEDSFFELPLLEKNMKLIQSIVLAVACATSAGVFAAAHTAAPGAAPMPPATNMAPAATPMTPDAMPAAKMTRAERSAAKKQINADEKTAMAACKKLAGAEKTACKKDANAKDKMAKAELKAK